MHGVHLNENWHANDEHTHTFEFICFKSNWMQKIAQSFVEQTTAKWEQGRRPHRHSYITLVNLCHWTSLQLQQNLAENCTNANRGNFTRKQWIWADGEKDFSYVPNQLVASCRSHVPFNTIYRPLCWKRWKWNRSHFSFPLWALDGCYRRLA